MAGEHIVVVEDNSSYAYLLESQLDGLGYRTSVANAAAEALVIMEREDCHLVISDLVMPGMDGQEFLRTVRGRGHNTPFIILTAHGSIESAVRAMKEGAFDYLDKDCSADELALIIRRALEFGRLERENRKYSLFREHVVKRHSFQSIVTRSEAMSQVLRSAERVASSPRTTVWIYGESGVGKEVLARAIHFAGDGQPANFVAVNCASIPETLLESELFGHVKGAFTGAYADREGKFELARGGSLMLDEIGDMPLNLQAKLLRVIEERAYWKIGSDREVSADFRVIAATHRDLDELVREGRFREDLFHRLNVFPIHIPPLRERREDIPTLVEHYLTLFRRHQGKPLPGISRKGMESMMAYGWPGNIREVRNRLERAAILVSDELIRPEHLGLEDASGTAGEGTTELRFVFGPGGFTLDAVVEKTLEHALDKCNGNKTVAAEMLGVNRKMFNRRGFSSDKPG